MKSVVFVLSVCIILISCKEEYENKKLYDAIVVDYVGTSSTPIIVKLYYQEDTIFNDSLVNFQFTDSAICCMDHNTLFQRLNIELCSFYEFQEKLYKKIVSDEYIKISKELYKDLKKDYVVCRNEKIDSLYNDGGIEKVLSVFVDFNGELMLRHISNEEYNYIIYLCFKHNILFFWDDETGKLFIEHKHKFFKRKN